MNPDETVSTSPLEQVLCKDPLPEDDVKNKVQLDVNANTDKEKKFDDDALLKEAKAIFETCEKQMLFDEKIVVKRTRQWLEIGKMLNIHKDNVEKAGKLWTIWATEKFPNLLEKRRQQCMALARFGPKVEQYLAMGIDRMYRFLGTVEGNRNHPDFDFVWDQYKQTFKLESGKANENEFNASTDKINKFFQFREHVRNKHCDKDHIVRAIETGAIFAKKDYENLNKPNMSKEETEQYLNTIILTGASPSNTQQNSTIDTDKAASIQVLITRLVDTINHCKNTNKVPQYLSVQTIDEGIQALQSLRDKVSL
jgi:hypothetical protein